MSGTTPTLAKSGAKPERIDRILARMGLLPDAEDRIRRLELSHAYAMELLDAALVRIDELEAAHARLRRKL